MDKEQEFFLKTDGEIARAIANNHKYFYLISQILPCKIEVFKNYYSKYNPETRKCRRCNPPKYDIILNLTS
jgi:hypothetical protein